MDAWEADESHSVTTKQAVIDFLPKYVAAEHVYKHCRFFMGQDSSQGDNLPVHFPVFFIHLIRD